MDHKFEKYIPKNFEKKWQDKWEYSNCFVAENNFSKPKFYALVEFPYPSGKGLHAGHPRPYTALDIIARKRRMQGFNVLYPIGWDAFGLPTENFALQNKIHPKTVTNVNINKFKSQVKSLGISFDWKREINTTDCNYYKWTQWIFLKMFEKGLAYKAKSNVNWCPSCKCVLANEEVVNGQCERCGENTTHKIKSQWILRITDYADRLIDDLDLVDYPERVKLQQKNWIGRSNGAEIDFQTNTNDSLKIYTTRPDTIFGVTYMAISPEHPLIEKWSNLLDNIEEINRYQENANKKSEFERSQLSKNKTGIKLEGVYSFHPVTNEKISIFVSEYILMNYGTGAVMAVPGHDERDEEFAKKYNLPIVCVIKDGMIINSGFLNGLNIQEAKKKIMDWLEKNNKGISKTNYRLRDWIFSRQRYWGEPIPIVHCKKCGHVPIPENELPLTLPEIESFKTTDDGQSPLSGILGWVNTKCPKCGKNAKRETDTMPQWAGSSWYFLRYLDPNNLKELASKELINYWMPVDWYNGGMEHTTLHLLYSRFWHKFLYDIGVVSIPEPYLKRSSHGMVLGENGEKMSKSRGNVINPDNVVKEYGADTMRLYEMFMGDFEKPSPWNTKNIRGCRRFLERVWSFQEILCDCENLSTDLESKFHKTIKKVSSDIENLKFNTAIAALMSLVNDVHAIKKINKANLRIFLKLLSPFAPHISEEIWKNCNLGDNFVCMQPWPIYDESKCIDNKITIAIQVCGKLKGTMQIPSDLNQDEILELTKLNEAVAKNIKGKTIKRVIYVKDKIINLVV